MPLVAVHDSPDVVAIIPTLGADVARLTACVDSLTLSTGPTRLGILIVLNSSTAQLEPIPGAEIVVAGLNLGMPGGVALGAAVSSSELLWLVQDDMVVDAACLETLVATLAAHPDVAATTPLVVDSDGLVPPRSCGGRIVDGVMQYWLPEGPTPPGAVTGLAELSYLPSRGLLVRRAAFERVGGLNPRLYPLQFVDVDFSLRLTAAGYGIRLSTDALTRHAGAASTPRGYALFLHERNLQVVRAEWFPDAAPTAPSHLDVAPSRPDDLDSAMHPIHPAISDELLAQVARGASDTLTHLARVYSATIDRLQFTEGERHDLTEAVRIARGDLEHARRDLGTVDADLASSRAEAEELRAAVVAARADIVAQGEEIAMLRAAVESAKARDAQRHDMGASEA